MSVISEKSKDCLTCKAISGFGLIGLGLYVIYHSRKFRGWENKFMKSVSTGLVFLGTARLLDIPPFPVQRINEDRK